MSEHYTARRYRERNAQIIRAYNQCKSTSDIAAIFDLSRRQIQRIVFNNTGEI